MTASINVNGIIKVLRFHDPKAENGYLSNWYMRGFVLDGKRYVCVEQYMMEQKALLFGDAAIASQVMKETDPQKMQDLGRLVSGFIKKVWDGKKQMIVYRGVREKFLQNPDLSEMLLSTGDAVLAECARSDAVWGIGLGVDDDRVDDPNRWNGINMLGFAAMEVRDEILRMKKGK